ncbi:MAG TPA: sigma 54-interacting transcriptional regulator [Thermodesulfobacteriota bacterium]|nr:sigma 54-interacting transcriptional regulator [Thermodesulfobacteriota bacterium]HNU72604.1 sigma 54-interacting transcriptional regulator [Thermodesulfobacteriota bacterium]HQO77993.1 sigma 54-interacting transcriptional regulator [Thermodesulfobacteriota bacterium]
MPKQPDDQLEVILNSIADGVFTIDKDKNITSFNKAAEDITGITREQAIGRKCFDVFQSNICQTSCALEKTIQTGKQTIDLKVNILNAEGRRIPVSISTAVLKNKKDNVIGGVETFRDLSTLEKLKKEITKRYTFEDIVSKHHKMQEIFGVLPDIAESESTVLIQGPSGSGKELFARAIHNLSIRKNKPYIVVNCGALPENLLESELFGYVKGAFTDAKKNKPGRFALAEGGTLFLDEIADLSLALQVKLLRVLQEKEYEPLGSTGPIRANVRIIAATNKDLSQLLSQGTFRDDLYYRINVVKIALPSLADRREDIPYLIEHFIRQFNLKTGRRVTGISDEVLNLFMEYDFPGNIRELENLIEHAFVLCRTGEITTAHLPRDFVEQAVQSSKIQSEKQTTLEHAEAQVILDTLKRHRGNRQRSADELGMHVTTLWRKMKRLGIES